jgi:uncharacterized damage-inducible protein DinB
MSRSEIDTLLDIIDQAFDRKSWHGTNLRGSLRGLTARQAAWRPAPARHSVHEIVLHAAYWKYVVRRKLRNEKRGTFPLKGSDWFTPLDVTDAVWKDDVKLLVATHESMRAAIADLRPAALHQSPGGSKVSHFALVSGVAAHDLYHAGQIQLIKCLGAMGRKG